MGKMTKVNAALVIAFLTLLPLLSAVPRPVSATITNRPTVYKDNTTSDPLDVQAGTYINISLEGMTISGSWIWLWLSPHGGAEINQSLGDRVFAGPFYMGEVTNTTGEYVYSWAPSDVPAPFNEEGATYTYVVGNNWINGTVPFMVEGGGKNYWIKIADITPSPYIDPSEIGVSNNRIRFTPNYYCTPQEGAPGTIVTVSGYAVPTTKVYNITQDSTVAYTFVRPATQTTGGWTWTGFSKTFAVKDLEKKVLDGESPPVSTIIDINVIDHNASSTVATFHFVEYHREVYLPDPSFIGHGGTIATPIFLTGSRYNITVNYFPASGSVDLYLNATLVAADIALNGTGGVKNFTITIPDVITGTYIFKVIDNNDVEYNFTVSVQMVPVITVDPTEGHVGDSFTVTGRNFLDYVGRYVTIYFEVTPYGDFTLLRNFTVPTSTWTLTLTVPHAAGGEREVQARDKTGVTTLASTIFKVLPKLVIEPSTIKNDGSLVKAVGTGLDADGAYTANIDNQYFGANNDGEWTTPLWANATGDLEIYFVAAGFRPCLHVFSLYPEEYEPPYKPTAYALFTVSMEGDMLADLLTSMNAIIVNINGTVATIQTDVGTIKTDISVIKANVTSIKDGVATIQTTLGTLTGTVTSIQGTVATINTNVGTIMADLTKLDAKIVDISEDIATIDTKVGTIKTDVSDIKPVVTSINNGVATIQTTLGTLTGTVTSIQGTVATINTNVGTIMADVSSLKTNLSGVPSGVASTTTLLYGTIVLALIAALASIVAVITLMRKVA